MAGLTISPLPSGEASTPKFSGSVVPLRPAVSLILDSTIEVGVFSCPECWVRYVANDYRKDQPPVEYVCGCCGFHLIAVPEKD